MNSTKFRLSFSYTKESKVFAKILGQIIEVCVFRVLDGESQYLLLQRAADEDLYPGIWQIVTGTIRQNESAIKAALRELDEETGLFVKRCWTVPYVDSYFDLSKDSVQLVPVFAIEVDAKVELKLSREHQNFTWLKYPDAKEKLIWRGQRHALEIVQEFIVSGKNAAQLLEVTKL
ncbi:MAG: NUDIX pyrophosphatase [Bacteroidota bacterium]